jgi:hypothetical protein
MCWLGNCYERWMAFFDIVSKRFDAEHHGAGLLHVLAHLLDVEQDQLVFSHLAA